jgi:hypothetical protein
LFAVVPAWGIRSLEAAHYRRSEEPYEANVFAARVAIFGAGTTLCFGIEVSKSPLIVRAPDAPDPALDNEAPDIHSDGVQCYVQCDDWQGFLLLPDQETTLVHVRGVQGTAADPSRMAAQWERTPGGYRVLAQFDVRGTIRSGAEFPVNVVINQMLAGRERRAGQLALSGGNGWVYLRGDRESPEAAVIAEMK